MGAPKNEGHTFPKGTAGENCAPVLFGVDGLLRGGLYPCTQLGENLGLAVDGLEGLKLNTLCPCRGDDCAGVGISLLSCFSLGGEAWISARRNADSFYVVPHSKVEMPF